ncbi:fungal-specific transcription factor domain-containing protein [Mycena vitilis]|nr:fungal-specific transcription factor domain-containing protein [Mycena vitilis]
MVDTSKTQDQPKRRRLHGACDICRKKKIRCDSSEMPGKCSNCVFSKTQCTHLSGFKDSSSAHYQNAREHVAAILSQTTAYVPSDDPTLLYRVLIDIAKYARTLEDLLAVSSTALMNLLPSLATPPESSPSADNVDGDVVVSNDGVLVNPDIIDPLRGLALRVPISGPADENSRYFGKSSVLNFIKSVVDYAGEAYRFDAQRAEFWMIHPWQRIVPEAPPSQCFPDDDLLQSLIDLYLTKIHPLSFVLHAPSFRAAIAVGEHLQDHQFGAVVLVVCAVASRLSDDPRVLMTTDAPSSSAGWKWFNQARSLELAISQLPNSRPLYKLQLICLSVQFLGGTTTPRSALLLSAIGLRIAHEMGAHRRSRYRTGSKVEGELLKRAFWLLTASDTILNAVFGRPTVTTMEDHDVDLPTECDDEYWDEPHAFQQPKDKPALAAYLNSHLRLLMIYNRAYHAIYVVKRQKLRDAAVVAELDLALNKWAESIPSHLRWDPNLEGPFLDQSTSLFMNYYHVQMMIHRPFIPAPGEASSANSTFPSLAICANSARSCSYVMEVHYKRTGNILHYPHAATMLFDSALILLLNVWGGRRQRLSPSDAARASADIKKCVDVLHLYEKRYPTAGRHCDLITEILNRGSGNTVRTTHPGLKRPVAEEEAHAHGVVNMPPRAPTPTAVEQLERLQLSIQETDHLFALPLYTQELGLLPVYEPFDFKYNHTEHRTPFHLDAGFDFTQLDGTFEMGADQFRAADADGIQLSAADTDPWLDWGSVSY